MVLPIKSKDSSAIVDLFDHLNFILQALLFIFSAKGACIIPDPIACIAGHSSILIEWSCTFPHIGATAIGPQICEKYPLPISAKAFCLYDEIIDLHKNPILIKGYLISGDIGLRTSDKAYFTIWTIAIRKTIHTKRDKQHEEKLREPVFHKFTPGRFMQLKWNRF